MISWDKDYWAYYFFSDQEKEEKWQEEINEGLKNQGYWYFENTNRINNSIKNGSASKSYLLQIV